MKRLSSEQLAGYERDGYVMVEDLVTPEGRESDGSARFGECGSIPTAGGRRIGSGSR
jgi:hypothetical protein